MRKNLYTTITDVAMTVAIEIVRNEAVGNGQSFAVTTAIVYGSLDHCDAVFLVFRSLRETCFFIVVDRCLSKYLPMVRSRASILRMQIE